VAARGCEGDRPLMGGAWHFPWFHGVLNHDPDYGDLRTVIHDDLTLLQIPPIPRSFLADILALFERKPDREGSTLSAAQRFPRKRGTD
jgi:hypothetical protein